MNKAKSASPKTIISLSLLLLILFIIYDWKWTVYGSVILLMVGLFSDYLSDKINIAWLKIMHVWSVIISTILLTIVFYLVLFPISRLSKLFLKKDSLRLKNNFSSMFVKTNKVFSKESFEKIW